MARRPATGSFVSRKSVTARPVNVLRRAGTLDSAGSASGWASHQMYCHAACLEMNRSGQSSVVGTGTTTSWRHRGAASTKEAAVRRLVVIGVALVVAVGLAAPLSTAAGSRRQAAAQTASV